MLERLGRRRILALFIFIVFAYIVTHLGSSSTATSSSRFGRTWQYNSKADEKYRHKLGAVRPIDTLGHSRTLGIAEGIYVVSLVRRKDRRGHMEELARALDLEFNYVNATDFSNEGKELVERLIERVRWQRYRIDEREATHADFPKDYDDTDSETFVWHAFPFQWSKDTLEHADDPLAAPLGISGADYWDLNPPDEDWEREHKLPSLTQEEREAKVMTSSVENNMFKNEPLNKAMVSCWHSHVQALREIVRRKNKVGIVFEDDIDLEWDIERLLRLQWSALPDGWDIVYLGHCFSEEYRGPSLPHAPMLHETFHTLCTHGYAVSLKGATKILRYLRSPDYAYSKPIDHGLKDLVQMHKIKSWSVYPPVVVQTKEDISDIVGGLDLAWKSHEGLVDSTLDRIAMAHKVGIEW